MKPKIIVIASLLLLFALAACATTLGEALQPTQPDTTAEPVEPQKDKVSVDHCTQPAAGTHQLIYAAIGVCFLYPDQYDVMQADDKGIHLYIRSLLNTEAPLFSLSVEPASGRSLDEVTAQRLINYSLPENHSQAFELGGEPAILLDNLPGQDTNRRVIAIYNGMVYDLMVARIGAEYGAVGEQAEALFTTITSSFQFIGIELHAPLLAGPECQQMLAGTTLFTNTGDGYCLLLPEGYAVDDSLTTENGGSETAVYMDSPQDASHARLFITVVEADGRSLEEATAAHEAEIEAAAPGSDVIVSFGYMLDGVAANQFDQVPGQDLSRQVLLVHNGRLYTLTFKPDDPAASEAYNEMQTLYEMLMDSFSFLWQQ